MHYLPFLDVAEAKDNAKALTRAFEYHMVKVIDGSTLVEISLQRTQNIIGQLFACQDWTGLIRRLELKHEPDYISRDDNKAIYRTFAESLANQLHSEGRKNVESIYYALTLSSLGCSLKVRAEQEKLFGPILRKFKTGGQFAHHSMLVNARSRWHRYADYKNQYEYQMAEYHHEVLVAELLELPPPKKPSKTKKNT